MRSAGIVRVGLAPWWARTRVIRQPWALSWYALRATRPRGGNLTGPDLSMHEESALAFRPDAGAGPPEPVEGSFPEIENDS